MPNDFGDDPWLIALRRIPGSEATPYLASFLLARAFGRRTRNCADLVQLGFDMVYADAERSALSDEAWRLLDDRLHRSYFWPNWDDRCKRIRQTTVDLFVNRELDPQSFTRITARDDVFAHLVDIAAYSYSGQRYLSSVRDDWLSHHGNQSERLHIVRRAMWYPNPNKAPQSCPTSWTVGYRRTVEEDDSAALLAQRLAPSHAQDREHQLAHPIPRHIVAQIMQPYTGARPKRRSCLLPRSAELHVRLIPINSRS